MWKCSMGLEMKSQQFQEGKNKVKSLAEDLFENLHLLSCTRLELHFKRIGLGGGKEEGSS